RGIRADRYFDFKDDYKGQITFFSLEVFEELCAALNAHDASPAATRRNVITRGFDLNEFIGKEFEIQCVRFYGTEESAPCYWMDGAFAPGAKDFLKGRGGLSQTILHHAARSAGLGQSWRGCTPNTCWHLLSTCHS